jgi:dTDP-4-amino-4,6-dideoxygalactose transaminase
MAYYPIPVHLQKAVTSLAAPLIPLDNSLKAAQCALSLPMHPYITDEEIEEVSGAIADFICLSHY